MTSVQSTTQSLLEEIVASGEEHGIQVAAYHHGDLVVDAWAGDADAASDTPVDRGTLFTVYSAGKGIAATVVHILAEQGKLRYDDPIAMHWPDFAQHGKEGVLIRHALSHTAGVPRMPRGYGQYDVTDWSLICDLIAGLEPIYPPGETIAYHVMTYGWLLGGLAERADGRPFRRIVIEEIAEPLGLDGLYFGVPENELQRIATIVELPDLRETFAELWTHSDIAPDGAATDATMNQPEMRQACLPSYGMCTNSRSLARVYAALIGNGVDGVRLFSPERRIAATTIEAEGMDASIGMPNCFALGYVLGGPESPSGPRRNAFGHPGYGGSYGFADPDYGLAVGLTKNRLSLDEPRTGSTWDVVHHIRQQLHIPD